MIRKWLQEAAQRHPLALALSCVPSGESMTYQDLLRAVESGALDYAPGQLVPMNPERNIQDVCRLLSVIWAGAIPLLGGNVTSTKPQSGTLLRLHSSGSTGEPKAIDLSEVQVTASVEASASRLMQTSNDSWACALPLTHVGGISILFRCIHSQSEAVLVGGSFDAALCSRLCEEGRVSQISLVPNQLQRMIRHLERHGVSGRLRLILLGGAAAPSDLVEACRVLKLPLARTWGMTECASQVATEEPGSFSERLRPLPGVVVLREEQTGRLRIEGAIAPGGSFLSNDVGEVSGAGVWVDGRVDDICVSGGENLSMTRIQRVLVSHPDIREAAVVKRVSEEWGERPHAVLVAQQEPVKEELIRGYLMESGLRKREIPDSIEWRKELPRTALGKICRGSL